MAALVCGAVFLASAALAGGAGTKLPGGPRLAVVVSNFHGPSATEVLTVGPGGEDPRRLAQGTFPGPMSFFEHPNWSPDGKLLAFNSQGEETPAVALLGADGSNLHLLRSSEHPGGPDNSTLLEPLFDPKTGEVLVGIVHTPHGEGLFGDARPTGKAAQFRGEFWSLPVRGGGKPRRLSSRYLVRSGIFYPSSIAADGTIAATDLNQKGFTVAVLDPRGGPIRTVVTARQQREGSLEPAISPDGSRIVYKVDLQKEVRERRTLIGSELMIVSREGGKPRRLAWVKGGAGWPTWDPSGSRIAFTAMEDAGGEDGAFAQLGNALMEINPDGTCLTKVYSAGPQAAVEGAAWQPGAERGVGPINC
ncbi:MAG: PD40 domain-containing protein [Actinobacteria bacterium]|nr:PD40 domain-containing protein [Actinomycetota bacterium]